MSKKNRDVIREESESQDLSPREKRIAKAQAKLSESSKEIDHKEEFRKFFIQLKTKHNLDPELENVIWVHLKAINCAEVDKFVKGISHFGYNFN